MVTIKFETEKLNSETIIFPTVLVATKNKKNCLGLSLGWLKRVLIISINWSSEVVKTPAQYQKSSY